MEIYYTYLAVLQYCVFFPFFLQKAEKPIGDWGFKKQIIQF